MGLRYIVSLEKREYDTFKCTQSLQNIEWDSVDALIFNTTKDSDVEAILAISKAGEKVPKIIYINNVLNSLFYGLFTGLEADIYNDESMLQDEGILDFLISNYHETGMTVKSVNADVETIAKFIATVSKENAESLDKFLKNQILVKTLENSVKSVETSLVRTDEANVDMVKVFNKTSEMIGVLRENQDKTTTEIEKLSQYLEEVENKSHSNNNGAVIIFPTYTVPNIVKKVLYIQVLSPCIFLNSFIGAYQNYLQMTKQLKVKVLIAAPRLKQYIKKYGELTRLAPETIVTKGMANNNVFVTFEPKSNVLGAFFDYPADLHIVIDMMFNDPLIKGAKMVGLSAVSSLSDIKRFNLDAKRCIVPISGSTSSILIPRINGYAYTKVNGKSVIANDNTKRSAYFEACKDTAYAKLDKLLGYN